MQDTKPYIELLPNVYWIKYNNKKTLGNALLRFQEYYESPKFKNTVFTHREFNKWYYSKYKNHYNTSFCGFNVPSKCLIPFYQGKFKKLTRQEKLVLNTFKTKNYNYYIIATLNNDKDTLKHEICHALWATKIEYKNKILEIMNKIPKAHKNLIYKNLKKIGYDKKTYKDELQAYVIADYVNWVLAVFKVKLDLSIVKEMDDIFNFYYTLLTKNKDIKFDK